MFNDWEGREKEEFVPGEVTKTAPFVDRTTRSPTRSASLPRIHRIGLEGLSNLSPVGAGFVPFPPKTGTNLLHLRPPPIVDRVSNHILKTLEKPVRDSPLNLFTLCITSVYTIFSVNLLSPKTLRMTEVLEKNPN